MTNDNEPQEEWKTRGNLKLNTATLAESERLRTVSWMPIKFLLTKYLRQVRVHIRQGRWRTSDCCPRPIHHLRIGFETKRLVSSVTQSTRKTPIYSRRHWTDKWRTQARRDRWCVLADYHIITKLPGVVLGNQINVLRGCEETHSQITKRGLFALFDTPSLSPPRHRLSANPETS